MSGEVVLMVLLGGLGTVFGPVVGALIIIAMENYLAQMGSWVTVVQGVSFVICVLTFRRGVVGELGRLIRKPLQEFLSALLQRKSGRPPGRPGIYPPTRDDCALRW